MNNKTSASPTSHTKFESETPKYKITENEKNTFDVWDNINNYIWKSLNTEKISEKIVNYK